LNNKRKVIENMNIHCKVLLVEDEESIRKFTKVNLIRSGFTVLEAENGEEGVEIARRDKPHIVILDIMLPKMDGYQVCSTLRNEQPNIGIIMLTAKTQDVDKILGLEQGADDYMVKPFNPKELILRIESLKRRVMPSEESEKVIEYPPFKLDLYSREFYKNNELIELTPTELSIMTVFLNNPGRAFSRNELLDENWGKDYIGETKIVDVNIRRLRSKIEDEPSKPRYLETVWGVGYRLK